MIFDHPDQLGSATSATDCTGNIVNAKLFLPFGEFWTGAANPNLGMHQMFAQLPDYDPETDEYNTANRHYSPSGRWLSPDPGGLKYVHLDDPQTWNMYAYVRDNPTTVTDPTGLGDPPPNGAPASAPGDGCDKPSNDCNNNPDTTTQQHDNGWQVTITQTSQQVMRGTGDEIIFYQEQTTTVTTYDPSGNVIDTAVSPTTITYASYALDGPGGTPRFVSGTGGQAAAEKALGGASHVYDKIASRIRTRGWIAFGSKVAAGVPAGAETGAGIVTLNAAKIAWTAAREYVIDHMINWYYNQGN
jgi:RHS repeat-associated protein